MDLHYMFTYLWPAMHFVFEIGYIPKESDFHELSPELYKAFQEKASPEDVKALAGKHLFAIVPDNEEACARMREVNGNNFIIVTKEECPVFLDVRKYFDTVCRNEGKHFDDEHDLLAYMASVMPSVFTDGTEFAVYQKHF